MMMTKTKKGNKAQADRVNSGAVPTTESSSAVALPEDQNHEAECQPVQEQSCDEFDMAIRELAHQKWEAAGFPAGDGFDFWLEAEREVKANQPAPNPASE